MARVARTGAVCALVAALSTGFAGAQAKEGDVIRRGDCGRASTWKLKLSPENRRIEVEFEVDQNRVGRRWRVVLRKDGARFFRGVRETSGPSGSFELRKVTGNGRGPDEFVAKATNLRSGERCRGTATFRR